MKINKTALQQALETVKPGLGSKEIVEQATSFAFLEGRVVTYNDEVSISCPLPGLAIRGAIRAEELYKLLAKVTEEELEIKVEGGEVLLCAGRASAGLPIQQEIKLPLEEVGAIENWFPVDKLFLEALKFAQYTCSQEASHPVLMCVHVDGSAGLLESSDNFRLTQCTIPVLPGVDFLLPAAVITALLQMKPVEMALGEGWVHFRAASQAVFSARLVEGAFPNIAPYLLVEDGFEINFPITLQDVLQRAAIFSTRDTLADNVVRIRLENRLMIIHGEGEYGWFKEELNYKHKGVPVSFSLNPAFLQQALKGLRKCTKGERTLLFEGETWKHAVALFKE